MNRRSGRSRRRASVDGVAREAGVAKGTISLYHESKEALFTAIALRVADQLETATAARRAEVPFPERLRLVLEAKSLTLFDVVTRSRHAAELVRVSLRGLGRPGGGTIPA